MPLLSKKIVGAKAHRITSPSAKNRMDKDFLLISDTLNVLIGYGKFIPITGAVMIDGWEISEPESYHKSIPLNHLITTSSLK